MRPGDPRSTPHRTLWHKMGESLFERDAVGNSVPDLRLKPMEKFGILENPNQTWFDRTADARQAFVQAVNQLMANSVIPPMIDRERTGWQSYFRSEEPVPAQTNLLAPTLLATTLPLDAYYVSDSAGRARLVSKIPSVLVIDGQTPLVGSTVLVKNQGDGLPPPRVDEIDVRSQNGIYMVITPGSISENWSLVRVPQFDKGNDLYLAQTTVTSGDQLAGSTWHQTNQNIQDLDVDAVTWKSGAAPLTWTVRVRDLAELSNLEYTYPFGTKVLVDPSRDTANKWTIFAWTDLGDSLGEWQLVRIQSYKTSLMWSQVDWYAMGYGNDDVITEVVQTLSQREQLRNVRVGATVKVNNIGDGTWELYVWTGANSNPWLLVGKQNGGIRLSDDLWNYVPPNMGFGAGGFGADYQGFEYDSRLELAQIFQGLWSDTSINQGLLKIGEGIGAGGVLTTVNEPNQLFFLMLNRVFSEQPFVDWAFKTSFVNLRGFAQTLLPTELYTTNKINSLIEYVKETKPYHVKLRQFVDWRRANDEYQGSFADFDKPPYVDPNLGVRILDVNNQADQVLLGNPTYSAWFTNHQLSSDLRRVRTTRTRLIYDRVSCNTEETYLPGFDADTTITDVINSLPLWISKILDNTVDENQVIQVQVTTPVTLTRNTQTTGGLANWTVGVWGLDRREEIDQIINNVDDVFSLINSVVPAGYTALVQIDDLLTWNWYQKLTPRDPTQPGSIDDWRLVAYQHNHGAVLRIDLNYQPTESMLPTDSPLLISGCASKLVTVDGSEFASSDSWDKTTWDNVRGWDYTTSEGSDPELIINNGTVGYQLFVGDGVKQEFGLASAPQDPNKLKVWVNGVLMSTPQAWTMQNQITQILISNSGVAYRVHDVLTVQGGTGTAAAQLKVTGINLVGAVTSIELLSPGSYTVVPGSNPVTVAGGGGVNATFSVRWGGTVLKFATPPSLPVSSKPNVWVVESGSTFNPTVSSVLDTTFDGGGLNRPHLEAGHPEELNQLWPRSSVFYDVYTVPSAGWGNMVTRVYDANGVSSHFDIGQSINEDGQVFVYVAGQLKTHGVDADYVINYQSMSVVFVNAPVGGRVSIISIGFGGASKGLGSWSLINEGRDYQLFDTVTLSGGGNARVQITAVKAVTLNIVSGGGGYLIGDLLYYRQGIGRETLVARVTNTGTTSSERGAVTQVEIINAGYYTNLSNPQNAWFTNGGGTDVVIEPSWGAADLFVINRGIYQQEPGVATQISAVDTGGAASLGSGIEIQFGVGRINQQIIINGDGVTSSVILNERTVENQLLVTSNGEATFDYGFDSEDPRIMVFPSAIPMGTVVIITVFNSEVYSLKRTQTFAVSLPTLTYQLDNAPGFEGSAGRIMVFANLTKLRPPRFWRGLGDGTSANFDVGFTATLPSQIKIWIDGVLVAPFDYDQGPGVNEITFSSPPPDRSVILVQMADDVLQDYDFEVENDQLMLAPWAVNDGDNIDVITFDEDSQTSFANDRFEGTVGGVYTLSQNSLDNSSMQVFVNGVLADINWDYEVSQLGGITTVEFPSGTHSNSDVIEVMYPTRQPAAQPVAMRMFKNIYDDVRWYRLSDQASTRLAEDLLWNSDHVVVEDGTMLSDATSALPGAVWIGSERIEYREKIVDATPTNPVRVRLSGLQRGSMGTSTGVTTDYDSQTHSGDGTSSVYATKFENPVVIVNGVQQRQQQDYQLVVNPPGLVPGTYVVFETARVPSVGAQNILMIDVKRTITNSDVSYLTGTLVRDASANQIISGGHVWPHGNAGIQYSKEPQSTFLLQQPGTRKK
jgi:hypothetical protein